MTPTTQRLLAALALAVAFLVMASVFVPFDSGAQQAVPLIPYEPHRDLYRGDVSPSTDAHEDLRSMGSLEQGCFIVYIYATDGGPRYTIYDRDEQREVATLLTAERVEELFPELPLPGIDFSAPTQLMVVPNNNGFGY